MDHFALDGVFDLMRDAEKALEFVKWHRRMVIEGQIKVSEYATNFCPCSDCELQESLEQSIKKVRA